MAIRTGNNNANTLNGTSGNDRLFGLGGADTLSGNNGRDTLDGGVGNDVLHGDDRFNDDAVGHGDDLFLWSPGGDLMYGGGGIDTVSYANANEGIERLDLGGSEGFIFVNGGAAEGDFVHFSIEIVIGSRFADEISSSFASTIYGGSGADILEGARGTDRLSGGSGADLLLGDDGQDKLFGGTGADSLLGEAGNDAIFGGKGSDSLDDGFGDDTVDGGAGADYFNVLADKNILTGGSGADAYNFNRVHNSTTVITDFKGAKGDTIDTIIVGLANWQEFSDTFRNKNGNVEININGGTTTKITLVGLQVADLQEAWFADILYTF